VFIDVVILFTPIPNQEALDYANEIPSHSKINPRPSEELLRLMKTCVEPNYFLFDGSIL
jgi:hypothetical protein